MPPRRAMISTMGTSIEKLIDGLITQKTNELQILSNESDSLSTELTKMKDRLALNEITIPDSLSSTKGYKEGSKLPFASVQDNLTMVGSMINSKKGELKQLNEVWTDYNQGKSLMTGLEQQYSALEGVERTDPESYLLSGGYDEPDTEMSQLLASLDPKIRTKLEKNPTFKEGFLAARTTDEEASNKALLRLNVLSASDQVRINRKTAVDQDFEKTRLLLDNSVNKYGELLSTQLQVAGTPLSMFGTTLTAGDIDTYNDLMKNISENSNLNLIQGEILTMIDAANANSYYPMLGVLGSMYEETAMLIDMENRWKNDMPGTYEKLVENAINGRYNLIDERFVEDAKKFHRLYRKQAQFREAGLMPDDDDLETALIAAETEKELTNTELAFLGKRASGDIDNKYYEGLGFDLERIAGRISEDYVPSGTEGEYLGAVDDVTEAHNAWLLMQDEDFADQNKVLTLNDMITTANDNKLLDDQLATSKKDFANARGDLNLELVGSRTELRGVAMSVPFDLEKLEERIMFEMQVLSSRGDAAGATKLKKVYQDYLNSLESYQSSMRNHQANRAGSWIDMDKEPPGEGIDVLPETDPLKPSWTPFWK